MSAEIAIVTAKFDINIGKSAAQTMKKIPKKPRIVKFGVLIEFCVFFFILHLTL